jgi:hypothetical protein
MLSGSPGGADGLVELGHGGKELALGDKPTRGGHGVGVLDVGKSHAPQAGGLVAEEFTRPSGNEMA